MMDIWSQVMNFFGFTPHCETPSREDPRRARQVYQSIQRANCAADHADKVGQDVLDQESALLDAEVDVLADEWRRRPGDQRK